MLAWIVLAMVVVFFVLQLGGVLEQVRRMAAERKSRPAAPRLERTSTPPGDEAESRLKVYEDFLKNLPDDDSPRGKRRS
jgi:hypothetical protein